MNMELIISGIVDRYSDLYSDPEKYHARCNDLFQFMFMNIEGIPIPESEKVIGDILTKNRKDYPMTSSDLSLIDFRAIPVYVFARILRHDQASISDRERLPTIDEYIRRYSTVISLMIDANDYRGLPPRREVRG